MAGVDCCAGVAIKQPSFLNDIQYLNVRAGVLTYMTVTILGSKGLSRCLKHGFLVMEQTRNYNWFPGTILPESSYSKTIKLLTATAIVTAAAAAAGAYTSSGHPLPTDPI